MNKKLCSSQASPLSVTSVVPQMSGPLSLWISGTKLSKVHCESPGWEVLRTHSQQDSGLTGFLPRSRVFWFLFFVFPPLYHEEVTYNDFYGPFQELGSPHLPSTCCPLLAGSAQTLCVSEILDFCCLAWMELKCRKGVFLFTLYAYTSCVAVT